jgi:acetyl esterase/lipase
MSFRFRSATLAGLMFTCSLAAQESRPAPPAEPAQTQPDSAAPTPPPRRPNQPQRPQRRPSGEGTASRNAANTPVPEGLELVRDVVYATAPDAQGKPVELKMDCAFLKQSDGNPMPVIVYIHGGGWQGGDRAVGVPLSYVLAAGGYFACTIDYRLSGQAPFPAQIHDVKAAIRFIRANADKLAIDPERIGVWGHSAGGHLSALLGSTGNVHGDLDGPAGARYGSSAVQAVVDICGPTDLARIAPGGDAAPVVEALLGGSLQDKAELAKQASPVNHVDAKDPPFLIIHGGQDRLVPPRQAEYLRDALKQAGVEVEYLLIEDADHGVTDRRAYRATAEFFDKHLKGRAAEAMAEIGRRLQNAGGAGRGGGDDRQQQPPAAPQPAGT